VRPILAKHFWQISYMELRGIGEETDQAR